MQPKDFVRLPTRREAAQVLASIESGIYYGYPTCCIEEFAIYRLQISGSIAGLEIRTQPRLCDGSGFVPCKICNLKRTRRELEEDIEKFRTCPVPFPNHDGVGDDPVYQARSQMNYYLEQFVIRRPTAREWLNRLVECYLGISS